MSGASIEELWPRGDWVSETVYDYIATPLSERIVNDMNLAVALATDRQCAG